MFYPSGEPKGIRTPGYQPEPSVDLTSRGSCITWLVWNDRNGCYTDEECASEGLDPIALEELVKLVLEQGSDS